MPVLEDKAATSEAKTKMCVEIITLLKDRNEAEKARASFEAKKLHQLSGKENKPVMQQLIDFDEENRQGDTFCSLTIRKRYWELLVVSF